MNKKGNGPVGTFNINVNVIGKGYAQISSSVKTYTFQLVTSSFSPSFSGVGGIFLFILLLKKFEYDMTIILKWN